MDKVITVRKLEECSPNDDLEYWLSRPAKERFAEVERLRRLRHGHCNRLERVAHVIQQEER